MSEKMTPQQEMEQLDLEVKRQTLEMTRQKVAEFNEKEEEKRRITRIRMVAIEKEQEERERRQNACRHKTGGKGKPGFLHGDGAKGYCVAQQVLPTGEVYLLCTRCQKEWHHPQWLVKIDVYNTGTTTMTKSGWDKMLAEYNEAMQWDHPYTETAEASQFKIPLLDRIDVSKVKLAPEEVLA